MFQNEISRQVVHGLPLQPYRAASVTVDSSLVAFLGYCKKGSTVVTIPVKMRFRWFSTESQWRICCAAVLIVRDQ